MSAGAGVGFKMSLGAMRIKLTNMLSFIATVLGWLASRLEPFVVNGCSPQVNLTFPACLGKCLGV